MNPVDMDPQKGCVMHSKPVVGNITLQINTSSLFAYDSVVHHNIFELSRTGACNAYAQDVTHFLFVNYTEQCGFPIFAFSDTINTVVA